MQFTCKNKLLYLHSRGKHLTQNTATAHDKARKLRVTSPAGCGVTHLQFACDFNRSVIAVLLAIAGFFCLQKQSILHELRM